MEAPPSLKSGIPIEIWEETKMVCMGAPRIPGNGQFQVNWYSKMAFFWRSEILRKSDPKGREVILSAFHNECRIEGWLVEHHFSGDTLFTHPNIWDDAACDSSKEGVRNVLEGSYWDSAGCFGKREKERHCGLHCSNQPWSGKWDMWRNKLGAILLGNLEVWNWYLGGCCAAKPSKSWESVHG